MTLLSPGQTYLDILAEKKVSVEKFMGLNLDKLIDYRAVDEVWDEEKYNRFIAHLALKNFIAPLSMQHGKMISKEEKLRSLPTRKKRTYDAVMYEYIRKIETEFNTISLVEREYSAKEIAYHKEEEELLKKKAKRSRVKYTQFSKTDKGAIRMAMKMNFGNSTLGDILPEQADAKIDISPSYMANRESFIMGINRKFRDYKDRLIGEDTDEDSCEVGSRVFNLMLHQELVRDYLNLFTPHRGLLLYHGLGAGKTCSSIAIAEGMKTDKEIFLLTPASLETNYLSELKHCGDALYKLDNYWQFLSMNDLKKISANNSDEYDLETVIKYFAAALSLKPEFIKNNKNPRGGKGGVWLIHKDGQGVDRSHGNPPMLYDELIKNPAAAKSLNRQLDKMIEAKYRIIHYNGLRGKIEDIFGVRGKNANPFDHKVVIIEESHNLIGGITNKLRRRSQREKDSDGNLNESVLKIYKWLQEAEDVRIVLLSGTPIVNYPNELAVMYNILRGKLYTFEYILNGREKSKGAKTILDTVKKLKMVDTVVYQAGKLTISRNPYGFISKEDRGFYEGVVYDDGNKNHNHYTNDEYLGKLTAELIRMDILNSAAGKNRGKKLVYKNLPDDKDAFMSMFIREDKKDDGDVIYDLKPESANLFKRRILGLTSYFRSTREELMPIIIKPKTNFPPLREIADTAKDGSQEIESIKQGDSIFDFEEVYVPMMKYQYDMYEKERRAERDIERNQRINRMKNGKDDIFENTSSTYKIFSRLACNFVFPSGIERPRPAKKFKEICAKEGSKCVDEGAIDGIEYDDVGTEKVNRTKDTASNYNARIKNSLKKLKENGDVYFNISDEENGLVKYSPKFKSIYDKIQENKNMCQLIYSQFRNIEGIEIFKNVLDFNGYSEFKIKKTENGWIIDMTDEDILGKKHYALFTGTEDNEQKEIIRQIYNSNWEKLPSKILDKLNRVLKKHNIGVVRKHLSKEQDMMDSTQGGGEGESDAEAREETEQVEEGKLAKASKTISMSEDIEKEKYDKNLRGRVIELFMITSSGAEGITLKNTRVVHLMEPYWHPVRLEQVIGRARRICSHHALLPGDTNNGERNVRVFLYMMAFPGANDFGKNEFYKLTNDCVENDTSRFAEAEPVTSDQMLYEISLRKKQLNTVLLDTIKSVAIDCRVYNKEDGGATMCFNFAEGTMKSKSERYAYNADYKKDSEDLRGNYDAVQRAVVKFNIVGIEQPFWKFKNDNDVFNEKPEGMNNSHILVGKISDGKFIPNRRYQKLYGKKTKQ